MKKILKKAVKQMSESIQGLLKAFAKQPGCEGYKGDAKQISLVCLYLFVRQLTPSLQFEQFLQLYAPFADADESNLKLPETAVDAVLPRAAAKAQKNGARQWSAKEVIGFLALYVDMIREAELGGTPVPMTLNEWIGNEQMQTMYLNGDFDAVEVAGDPPGSQPEVHAATVSDTQAVTETAATDVAATTVAAKPKKSRAKKSAVSALSDTCPTKAGQRVLYRHPNGQHIRGVTTAVVTATMADGPRVYATIVDDSGQLHEEVAAPLVTVIDDPLPQPPQNVSPEAAVVQETIEIGVTDQEATIFTQLLKNAKMVERYQEHAELWAWDDVCSQAGVEYRLCIKLKNGDAATGPYVDAYAADADSPAEQERIVFEIPPRNFALLGEYMFVLPHGAVRVVIQRDVLQQ